MPEQPERPERPAPARAALLAVGVGGLTHLVLLHPGGAARLGTFPDEKLGRRPDALRGARAAARAALEALGHAVEERDARADWLLALTLGYDAVPAVTPAELARGLERRRQARSAGAPAFDDEEAALLWVLRHFPGWLGPEGA